MMRRIKIILSVTLAAVIVGGTRVQVGAAEGASAYPVCMVLRGVAVQLTLGLKDRKAKSWDGAIRVSQGRVVRLTALNRPAEQVAGLRWNLRTRAPGRGAGAARRFIRLLAVFDAPPEARVEVTTAQGDFSFTLREATFGRALTLLGGQVRVERVPLTTQLSREPTDDDFPAAAVAPDGTVWLAYVAYQHGNPIELPEGAAIPADWSSFATKGNGDQIRLLHFDGQRWSTPLKVTEGLLDLWRPAVVVDGQGQVWVFWSQNVGGNWDLFARRYDPQANRWSEARRLTTEPGADINVVAATGPAGEVCFAWQGWRGDNFDIFLRLGEETLRLSESPANDWSPALAFDSQGQVYVAWDTYDRGNYDVLLWTRRPDGQTRVLPVANTPLFEARPSLAVDRQDRLWIAYEEAAANWGKDFGMRWEGPSGVPFYLDRRVIVRCYAQGRVQQTKDTVTSELVQTRYPPSRRMRLSLPRLGLDPQGRLWLLFRRHPLPTGAGEVWVSYATYYQGDHWADPILVPNSENLLDNRPALVPLRGAGLLALYSSDARTRVRGPNRNNDLHATLLSAEGPVQPPQLADIPPAKGPFPPPVHPKEAREVQRLRDFRVRVGGRTYQLLRGEFHRHTEISSHRDQDGPLEEIWRYGLDVARLDWIGSGDHDNGGGREYTWWLTQKQTDIFFHPPTFIPMFTYERSVRYPSGHRNVMFARRGIRTLPRAGGENLMGTPERGSPDVKRLFAYLKFFDGICSSHTSATNMGTDWRDNDPQVEPVVEIYQGHRQNYEEPKAPLAAKDAQDSIGGYRPAGFVWNALAKGYRLGFQVSSDHVSTHLSYGTVFAESPTREAILEAFKRRHCYGAMDNILLLVRSGEHLMGDEFTTSAPPRLDISVVGTAPVARIAIVRDNEYVYTTAPNQTEVQFTWTDTAPKVGQMSYYYVRIEQADGKLAWASPMWIRYAP
ncbi:MAG TPA: hypothetical protein EYP85_12335 [Armatimonadetes bacterium]|nr:hypothetical protein [Armatimonadota bacterium]